MAAYFILEEEHHYSHHDGGGSGTYKRILAIGGSEKELIDRWNEYCKLRADEVKDKHPSYSWYLPKPIEAGKNKVSYNGSTGGGYASSSYHVHVKPFEAFDAKKGK